jgi:butyrate kinase
LIINPGSTTTKIAVYEGLEERAVHTIDHDSEELRVYLSVMDQREYRFSCISAMLERTGISFGDIDLVMGRGGLLHALAGGVYAVSAAMLEDLQQARYGEHASNLGAPLAAMAAQKASCRALIADPVVVDELIDEARVSGMPELDRKSIFHALNHKIAARETAQLIGTAYEDARLIVAHLGGGISVGAHCCGQVIDVNNALDGEGPFTPERSGGLPAGDLMRLAFSGRYSQEQLQKKICGMGGMMSYLETSDMREIIDRIDGGDACAAFYTDAMIYQVAKEIGAMGAVLHGRVDAVVVTGGIARSEYVIERLRDRISYLAEVFVIPGEREMLSLAENALAVYTGSREVMEYEQI